jgi:hypothetical protein
MTTDAEVFDSPVGPVITVSPRSGVKIFFTGLFPMLFGGLMLFLGIFVIQDQVRIYLSKEGKPEDFIVVVGILFAIVGWVLATTLVRSLRAGADKRIYFRAGPGGVSAAYPGWGRLSRLFLSYKIRSYDFAWQDVERWHTYAIQKGFYTFGSRVVFVGKPGWRVEVPTRFFSGTRESIAKRADQARQRTDLLNTGQ